MSFYILSLVCLFAIKFRKRIPIRSRNGIIGYTTVSFEDYEHLNQFRWHLDKDGYVRGGVNGVMWRLSRYVEIILKGNKIDSKIRVDHINGIRTDNRRPNLRPLTSNEDRNKRKRKGTTSKYHGVSLDKKGKIWRTNIRVNGRRMLAFYEKEEYAAHQYNLWVDQFNLKTAPKNDISIPSDFVLWKNSREGRELPKNICNHGKGFRAEIGGRKYKTCKTVEEAIRERDEVLEKIEKERLERIRDTPILRNEKGIPIIELFNKNGKKIEETMVDENIYHDLVKYSWSLNSNGYVQGYVEGETVLMSRYLMNYKGGDVIDHLNENRLDNRRKNLRVKELHLINLKNEKYHFKHLIYKKLNKKEILSELTFNINILW